MSTMSSQITSLTIIYSTVYSDGDQRKYPASLAFVWGIHRWPVNSPHKWPVTRKYFLLMTSSCVKILTGRGSSRLCRDFRWYTPSFQTRDRACCCRNWWWHLHGCVSNWRKRKYQVKKIAEPVGSTSDWEEIQIKKICLLPPLINYYPGITIGKISG